MNLPRAGEVDGRLVGKIDSKSNHAHPWMDGRKQPKVVIALNKARLLATATEGKELSRIATEG